MFKKFLALGVGILIASPASALVYDIDPSHTTFGFGVKHLLVSTTKGEFSSFSGTIEYDPADPSKFKADVTINVTSIDTRNTDRDKHLKSADFFDADNFPRIIFKNANLIKTETGGMAIVGDLTIKDVTKKITIPVEVSGPVKSPMGGKNVIGIAGETTVNRQDFGITFNKAMETGGLIVDNIVKIVVDIEAHEQKSEPAAPAVKTAPQPVKPAAEAKVMNVEMPTVKVSMPEVPAKNIPAAQPAVEAAPVVEAAESPAPVEPGSEVPVQ